MPETKIWNHFSIQMYPQGHHKFPPKYAIKKPNQIASAFHSFSTIFSYTWAGNTSVYSMKSMFWTNEKLSLMVAWSSSVSISCFKVQSSIGHLVWFFDSGNSIVSGASLWCPYWDKTWNGKVTWSGLEKQLIWRSNPLDEEDKSTSWNIFDAPFNWSADCNDWDKTWGRKSQVDGI